MSLFSPVVSIGVFAARAPLRAGGAVLRASGVEPEDAQAAVVDALDRALLGTVDAVLARVLAPDVVDLALDRAEEAGVVQRIAERLLEDGVVEQIAERALAGPEAERLLAEALRGPLVEETVAQLLQSQAIWVLVDEIARSPSVTEAIAHQGTGFLDQVTDRLRERSRKADGRVARLAERLGASPPAVADGPQVPLPLPRAPEDL